MLYFITGAGLIILISYLITGLVRRHSLKKNLLDYPNQRSSHQIPTPRGGGLSVVVVVLLLLPLLVFYGCLSWQAAAGIGTAGAATAAVGWLDDIKNIAVRYRLAVHFFSAFLLILVFTPLPELSFWGKSLNLGWLGSVAVLLFVVWMINLFNFMDGIDGLAGAETVTVCFCIALLLALSGETGAAAVVLAPGLAALGFLVWNWPPARIFMGDCGSGFLGCLLAGIALYTLTEAGLTIWAWLIMLGVFIVDATFTLVRRILTGKRFYQAHRDHAYQHAAFILGSHRSVTTAATIINIFWLFPLAALTVFFPEVGFGVLFVSWLPLAGLCIWYKAGAAMNNSA